MSVRITAGSRLHFGLLNPSPYPMPRLFGGCGMMIDEPALIITAEPARDWHCVHSRALEIARLLPDAPFPCRIVVQRQLPEHAGLGSGTQLALAVAIACHALWDRTTDALALACLTSRGRRSAIGIHGFAQGGVLVDGGHAGRGIAPLIVRHSFPSDWRVVLALPDGPASPAGRLEQSLIASLPANETLTGVLSRILLLGVLPALTDRDLPAFGEALGEYNARAGELFSPVQRGIYSSPEAAALVGLIRSLGVPGAGQSSWGPCVFAITDAEKATWLSGQLGCRAWVANGRDSGATIDILPG